MAKEKHEAEGKQPKSLRLVRLSVKSMLEMLSDHKLHNIEEFASVREFLAKEFASMSADLQKVDKAFLVSYERLDDRIRALEAKVGLPSPPPISKAKKSTNGTVTTSEATATQEQPAEKQKRVQVQTVGQALANRKLTVPKSAKAKQKK